MADGPVMLKMTIANLCMLASWAVVLDQPEVVVRCIESMEKLIAMNRRRRQRGPPDERELVSS